MKPPLIIAELSANHQQDLQIAKDSIYAIAKSGADGVKLQTYTPSCLTLDSKNPPFAISGGTLWNLCNALCIRLQALRLCTMS